MPSARNKENLAPHSDSTRDTMSQHQRKRKAEAPADSSTKKGKAKASEDVSMDTIDDLRADNRALRARLEELSSTYDDMRKLRYTEPEQEIKKLLEKSQAVQKGLEASVRDHKEETKRMRQKSNVNASPERPAPASPPIAASQTKQKHASQQDETALARAREEGAQSAKAKIQELEDQILDLQTRFSAEKKKQRKAALSEPEGDAAAARDLLSDLSGFTVRHVLEQPREDVVREFACLLTGATSGLTITFRLAEHPDESLSYTPDLQPGRDDELLDLLTAEKKLVPLSRFLRTRRDQLPKIAKKLYAALNEKAEKH